MMLLKNCRTLEAGKEIICEILINNGKIEKIGHDFKVGDETETIDLKKLWVLPGVIDPHVHFRDPGMTHKEDFYTGSRAAVAGGVTTFIDMPNTIPNTITVESLEEKRKLAAEKSLANFGFHFGGAIDNTDEIKKATNVASTKVFMNLSTGKMMIEDDEKLKEIFKASKIVTVHAEDEMVDKAIEIAKETETKLYLCHISTRDELDVIRDEKDENLFVEATPHHLFLSDQDDRDNFTKMKPPLRTVLDSEALLGGVNDGLVDTIGTDHAPHTVGEKMGDEVIFGVPGIETCLPLLLNEVNNDTISMQRVIDMCATNPAQIFGIKNKGKLAPGYDADLTVVDMDLVKTVDENELQTKCKWSPFEGRELKGWPVMTFVNGNVVFNCGEIYDDNRGKEVEFK